MLVVVNGLSIMYGIAVAAAAATYSAMKATALYQRSIPLPTDVQGVLDKFQLVSGK